MAEAGAEVHISQPEPSKGMMTRRTFLKMAAALTGAAIGGMGGQKLMRRFKHQTKKIKLLK